MKENSLIEYLLYLPISLIVIITKVLPIRHVLRLGESVGLLIYFCYLKRRRVTLANLKAAYGKKLSRKNREKIAKKMYRNFGLNITELFLMPRMGKEYFKEYTKVTNINRIKEACQEKKGIVFLTAHYGNWELAASIASYNGYSMHALARVQKPKLLNDLLNHNREVRGTKIIQKGMQLREIVKNLKDNGIVGMVGDQSGKEGQYLDFFGRPVYIAEGAFRIAGKTKSPILPAFVIRRKEGYHLELVIEKRIQIRNDESLDDFIKRGTLKYRDLLEKYIRKKPHLWLWGNKRWKHSKARSVMILSDGKTGHLRQAQAVAKAIKRNAKPVNVVELDVVFKSKIRETLLTFFVLIFKNAIRQPVKYLKWALKAKSFKQLDTSFTNIIICTGSSTRAVGLLLSMDNLAKTISVMKPEPFREKYFDLSIIPFHDNPRRSSKVLITDGALNTVDKESLSNARTKIVDCFEERQGLKVGLFIGGDSKHFCLDVEYAEKIFNPVKEFIEKNDAWLFCSTSRRTSKKVDKYLKDNLSGYERCLFSVFPNDKNYDFTINGILSVVDVVVVTGESISMVSEAAASSAYTIVVPIERRSLKRTRHDNFIDHLKEKKFIRVVDESSLEDELYYFKRGEFNLKILNDNLELDKCIKNIIL